MLVGSGLVEAITSEVRTMYCQTKRRRLACIVGGIDQVTVMRTFSRPNFFASAEEETGGTTGFVTSCVAGDCCAPNIHFALAIICMAQDTESGEQAASSSTPAMSAVCDEINQFQSTFSVLLAFRTKARVTCPPLYNYPRLLW